MKINLSKFGLIFFFILSFLFFLCYAEFNFGVIQAIKNTAKKFKKQEISVPKENHPPVISGLSSNPSYVFIDKIAVVICFAYDEDNDPLSYSWSSDAGSISVASTEGHIIHWNAPLSSGTYNISCVVKDPQGLSALSSLAILVKYNYAPKLVWTEEPGYENDAVEPDTAPITATFEFRIKYIDKDGDPPMSGYPYLHIEKSGQKIYGSPFAMNYVSGEPLDGAIFSRSFSFYERLLPQATDYKYYFEARDQHGNYTFTAKLPCPYISSFWEIQEVDISTDIAGNTSIVLDSFSNPHICYFDYEELILKYASFKDTWSISIVDSGSIFCSMCCDSSDVIHIAYYSNGKLKYAKKLNNFWHIETVDTGSVGQYNSIAVDSFGNVHISYYDLGNQDLKYAKHNGVSWSTYTVDSSGNVGTYSSLVVDSSGNVHISYCDLNYLLQTYLLKYAKYDGISWTTSTLTTQEEAVAGYSPIAVDSLNRPWIAYFDDKSHRLNCINWIEVGSFKGWRRETIERDIVSCGDISIKLDSDGWPCVSYFTQDGLKYAKKISGGWFIQFVEQSSNLVLGDNSLVIDKSNIPHISYFDPQRNCLKYAKWRP